MQTRVVDGIRVELTADEIAQREAELANPPAPKPDQVNRERDRRLAADFEFQGKMYQRDDKSIQRITGAATLAGFAVAQGAQPEDYNWHGGDQPFAWIASDNSLNLMDAQTAFAFGAECANVETRIVFAAKALREMDPIPHDYADDRHWPDAG